MLQAAATTSSHNTHVGILVYEAMIAILLEEEEATIGLEKEKQQKDEISIEDASKDSKKNLDVDQLLFRVQVDHTSIH